MLGFLMVWCVQLLARVLGMRRGLQAVANANSLEEQRKACECWEGRGACAEGRESCIVLCACDAAGRGLAVVVRRSSSVQRERRRRREGRRVVAGALARYGEYLALLQTHAL